ncbi:MAG: prepilin-type N-terminal cleavage/methylation domain-containing protein [Phycisphaerales bacterium]
MLRARPGFTIVEVIIVIVLIAVLSGVVVPRLLGGGGRQAEQEARAVRMLLTTLAQRDSISGRAMALEFDADAGTLMLLVRQSQTEDASTIDGAVDTALDPGWKAAPMVRPVNLKAAVVLQATSDGRAIGAGDARGAVAATSTGLGSWRLEIRPSEPRPAVSILLGRPDGSGDGRGWQVDLLPGQTAATLRGLESAGQWSAAEPESIDLDSSGMREASW